jgi:hypothetical protein
MERPSLIPVSIEAKTRSELSAKMLQNNFKYSSFFRYFDIQKDGKRWVAWYYADIGKHVTKHQLKMTRPEIEKGVS